MKHKMILTMICILAVGFSALSCSNSESRYPFAATSTAIINLAHADAPDQALSVDIPKRYASSGTAPAQFDSVKVRITGSDIGTIEKNVPYSDTITMDVPGGAIRNFEVTAYVTPSDPCAALSFQGSTSVYMPAATSVAVPVLMLMKETKIVVPDNVNNRIVQFNKLSNASDTWISSTNYGNFGLSSAFYPTAVDFDSKGRILIINNPGSSNNIFRVDNIMSSTRVNCLSTDEINPIVSMAVDRKRGLLYYATNNDGSCAINRVDLSLIPVESPVTLINPIVNIENPAPFYSITALDVADDGTLFIVGTDAYYYMPVLIKYNPLEGIGVLVGLPYLPSDSPWFNPIDVMARGNDAIVLNNAADYPSGGWVLLKFSFDAAGFTLGSHFGDIQIDNVPDAPSYFYGPQKFAIRREDVLVIIDEYEFFGSPYRVVDRLVFTDFDLSYSWSAYGVNGYNHGSDPGSFRFYQYSYC